MMRKVVLAVFAAVVACGLMNAAPCWSSAGTESRVQQGIGWLARRQTRCMADTAPVPEQVVVPG